MAEAAFPMLGAAFVALCVLPLCAVCAKLGLAALERAEPAGPLRSLNLRYLLLTAPSMLPLAWFFSAGLHQAEAGRRVLACMLDHAGPCAEPILFAALIGLGVAYVGVGSVRRSGRVRASASAQAEQLRERLRSICSTRPSLTHLPRCIVVTDEPSFALATRGLLRPRVFIGSRFAATLSDEMLASALGHEQEHVRLLDPLRFLLLELALRVNPLGRALLGPHALRWREAQEVHCDREAVLRGAAPLPLAEAILRAARPGPLEAAALGARDTAVLQLRVRLLLAFAERAPTRFNDGRPAFPLTLALLVIALALPHGTGTEPLDALHSGAEQAASYFWP